MKKEFKKLLLKGLEKLDLQSYIYPRYKTNEDFLIWSDSDEDCINLNNFLKTHSSILNNYWNEQSYQYKHGVEEDSWLLLNYIMEENAGFSDDFRVCEECYSVVYNSAIDYNYYKEMTLLDVDEECIILCRKCLKEYYEDVYINSCKNNHNQWITFFTVDEMKEKGWISLNITHENGFYEVQDNPESIFVKTQELYPDKDVIFVRTNENPFMQEWQTMIKEKEE